MKINFYKKGISLVVLVITVIIMAILLGAVILEISDSGVETKAEEAAFKQTVSSFKDELDLYLNQQKLDSASNGKFFQISNFTMDSSNTKNIITSSIGTNFENKLEIKNGKLKLIEGSDFSEEEKRWFDEVN